jgi:hypothetical protein
MRKLHYIFHLIAYYIAWSAGIYLAGKDHAWWATVVVLALVTVQICWQKFVKHETKYLWLLILLLTVIGTLTDTIFLHSGLIHFNANPFDPIISPPWIISMWISFAVIFFATLKRMFQLYFLLSLLSFIGFSLAYGMGAYLHAAFFPHGALSCLLVGATWAILLPLCMLAFNRMVKNDN